MRVAIAGGGNVGIFIADNLRKANHEVMVIEQNADLVELLRPDHDLEWVLGDACEFSLLQESHLETVDVVVAATGDDEDNLVISLLAKQEFAVPKVVARVNHPKNHWLFNETWGVDVSVSTPHLLTALVEEAVSVGSLVRLLEFEGGDAGLIEVTLAEDSPAVGKSIVDLGLSRDVSVVAIVRGHHVVVPRGDTVLAVGDEVLALITGDAEADLKATLIGGEEGP